MSYEQAHFHFGASPYQEINGPYACTTSVVEYDDSSLLITTPGDLFLFRSNEYKGGFYYKFVAATYSRNHEYLFGVTENPSTVVVLNTQEINTPVVSGHPIAQTNVKKIFFFEQSKMIVIVGDSVRCYGVFFDPFSIYLDKIFSDEIILSKPSLADYENEIVYYATESGYSGYSLNGVRSNKSYFLDTIKYSLNNLQDFIIFDSEHIIILTQNYSCYLINIKTKKSIEIIRPSDQAHRIFLTNKDKISLNFDGRIGVYKISLFWKSWISSLPTPYSIQRYNTLEKAGRVIIQGQNSNIFFTSPRDGLEIAKIETPNECVVFSQDLPLSPTQFFYDRGYYIYTQYQASLNSQVYIIKETTFKERMILLSREGFISIYNTNVWPFKEISWKNAGAISMCICRYENAWFYLILTNNNELLLMNTHTFEFTRKFDITGPPVLYAEYYYPTNLVLLIREAELTFYDLKKDWPICRRTTCKFRCYKLNADLIYLGFDNGSIERLVLTNRSIRSKGKTHEHEAPVIDFAFSASFWLSASEDGTIFAWDYTLNAIFIKIVLPIPPTCISVINGYKDVLVGIENSVMILDRSLFSDKPDKEFKKVDSYDKIKDRFVPISADEPINSNEYIEYQLQKVDEEEFMITMNTVRASHNSVRPPYAQKEASNTVRMNRFLFSNSQKNKTYQEAFNPINDLLQTTREEEENNEINQEEEQYLELPGNDDESDTVYETEKTSSSEPPPQRTQRLITSPLLTTPFTADDELFINTQQSNSLAITSEMKAFANDADSDSDDDDFFKERFPVRMRNSLYIESTKVRKQVPYIPIATDLYTSTQPKLRQNATIITPKPSTARKPQPLNDSDMLYARVYLKKLSNGK